MPVKDLSGPPRPTPAERAFMREIAARIASMRRGPDGDGLLPATPPGGPLPTTGGAAVAKPLQQG